MTSGDNLIDKGGPVVWPFLFEDRDEHEIELVQEGSFAAQAFFAARSLDDEVDDKVSNS